jgi:hypothetical protein
MPTAERSAVDRQPDLNWQRAPAVRQLRVS